MLSVQVSNYPDPTGYNLIMESLCLIFIYHHEYATYTPDTNRNNLAL